MLYKYITRGTIHAHNESAQSRRFNHADCPPAILDLLNLKVGATVGLEGDGERLVIQPNVKPRYTVAELLEVSDYSQPLRPDEREWIDAPPMGGELL